MEGRKCEVGGGEEEGAEAVGIFVVSREVSEGVSLAQYSLG